MQKRQYIISEEKLAERNAKIKLTCRKHHKKAYTDDAEYINIFIPVGVKEILKSLGYVESQIVDLLILDKLDNNALEAIKNIYQNLNYIKDNE